jgi:hypothetical protein
MPSNFQPNSPDSILLASMLLKPGQSILSTGAELTDFIQYA